METIMNENNQQQKEVEMEELQQLLNAVYEATEDIKQGEKEPFNVFELCGVWSTEMRHSAILAYLLNPQSSHKFGTAFLKKFYEQIGLNHFTTEGSHVETELSFDNGRMDIVILNNHNQTVVIENKIYAKDQKEQLGRYQKWLKGKGQFALLYLTLDGHEASEKDVDYLRISYRNDILQWLDKCINITTQEKKNTFATTTLTQYKELIMCLTKTDITQEEKEKVAKCTTANFQTYKTAALIAKAQNIIHEEILKQIVQETTNDISAGKEPGIPQYIKYSTNQLSQARFAEFSYDDKNYKIIFEFQQGNYTQLFYGLHDLKGKKRLDNRPYDGVNIDLPEGINSTKIKVGIPNDYGWIIAFESNIPNWDINSFSDIWEEETTKAKKQDEKTTNKELSLEEIKNKFKEEIKQNTRDLIAIIRENKEKLDNPNLQ